MARVTYYFFSPGERLRRRLLRWLLRFLVALLLLALLGAGLLWFLVGTETGSRWVVSRVVQSIDEGIPGSIEFDYTGGTLLGEFHAANIVIRDPAGYEVIRVAEASATIDLTRLLDGVARFEQVRGRGIVVEVRRRRNYFGLARAFAEPSAERPGAPARRGGWLFDLPDIRLADLRVRLDLQPLALDVRFADLQVAALAGRGSHRAETRGAGVVALDRVGSVRRRDRIEFSGDLSSRSGRWVEAKLDLAQDRDRLGVRLVAGPDGFHGELHAGPDGIDLERYLAETAPDLRPGTARALSAAVDGPDSDLAFRLAAVTDAGALEGHGRLRGPAGARRIEGRFQLDDLRPARLGVSQAPPDLAFSAGGALQADLAAGTADALLAGLRFAGIEVPGQPHSGSVHLEPRRVRLDLFAADGSNELAARIDRPAAGENRTAAGSARLAAGAAVHLPGFSVTGPAELKAEARWADGEVDAVRLEWTGEGPLAAERPALIAEGPWSASLDARRAPDGGWTADARLLGAAGATLQAGSVTLNGPLRDVASPADAPTGVPIHAALDAEGTVRIAVAGASLASVRDDSRGLRNTEPLVVDATLTRTAGGALALAGTLRSNGDLVAGPQDTIGGPLRASAELESSGGEWRLVRGEATATGARHGDVRSGPLQATLDPAAGGRSSRVRATVTGLRRGSTRIGTVTADLTGNTRAGSGVVRLDAPGADVSATVRLRRTEDRAVEADLQGGLLESRGTALRFHGSLRVGPAGLELPGLIVEGQGATGRLAGTLREWRRLRFEGQIDELPVAALFDLAALPPSAARLVHGGRIHAEFEAGGTTTDPTVRFSANVSNLAVASLEHVNAETAGTFENGTFRAAGRAQLANGGTLLADLTVPAGGGAVAYLQAADVPLDALHPLLPERVALRGTLADGSALYHAEERTLEVQVRLRDFAAGGTAPWDGWADLRCAGTRCRDRFRFTGRGGAVVEGDGRVDFARPLLESPDLRRELLETGRWLQRVAFADLEPADLGLAGPDAPSGRFSGTAVLTGSPLHPRGRAELEGRDLRWTGRPDLPPLAARLVAALEPDALRLSARVTDGRGTDLRGVAEWPAGLRELLAGGDLRWRPDLRLAGSASGEALREALRERLARPPAERVGLQARWQPADRRGPSRWTATVVADGLSVGDVPVPSAAVALDGRGTRVSLLGAVRNREAAALHLGGSVELPADPGTPVPSGGVEDAFPDLRAFGRFDPAAVRLDLLAVARGLDLSSLPPLPAIEDLRGRASLDLTVAGPVLAPQVAGSFHIQDAGFVLVPTAQRFERAELLGNVDGGRVTLERAAAASGGGRASAHGTIDVARLDALAFDLRLDSTDFPIVGEGTTYGRITCEVAMQGGLGLPADGESDARRIEADLAVADCLLLLPRQRSQAVMEMGDHPDFVVGGRRVAAPENQDDGAVPLDVLVRVDVPGELVVRREDMQVAGVGQVVFRREPSSGQAAALSGSVEVRRGWADMFGRRFDVEFGDVVFTGRHPIDGTIDVRLAAETAEGPVYIDVTGTLRHPQIQLTSDPPRDQGEILALLFLGRTEVADEERLAVVQQADRVAQGVAEAVGLAFFQSEVARRFTPLSVLRLDPGQQGLSDARIRAGMNLLDNLYVEYAFQPAADELQNSNEGRIEWLILRNLSLEGYFGDAQSGGIHLQYRTEW